MKYIFKVILTISLLLFSYQIGSYYLDGKESINVNYYKYHDPLVGNINKLGVISNYDFQNSEKVKINDYLEDHYKTVDFLKDSIEDINYIAVKNNAIVEISVDFKFPFHAIIYEYFRSEDYVEVWESDLTWFFGNWILNKRTNIGQT
nr:hypothetical protein [uncultured Carboxylicivirga sp.]